MPDEIERKRLKKKMLDRWENEGGRVAADSVIANQSNPVSQQRERKGSQAVASNISSKIDSISSRKKRRRTLTQK